MKTSYYLLHCVWLSSLFMSYPGAMGSGICGCVCSNSNEIPNTGGQAGQYPLTGYKCPKGTYKVWTTWAEWNPNHPEFQCITPDGDKVGPCKMPCD